MSFEDSTLIDYPLSDSEKYTCISTLENLAIELFGPSQDSNCIFNKIEKLLQDFRYFYLVRKVINTENIEETCIDLSIFYPDPNDSFHKETDDYDNTIYLYKGSIREITSSVTDKIITVCHSIGHLAVNEIADVTLNIVEIEDEEPIDPAFAGGKLMLSDQLSISEAIVSLQ
jgi:ACT domain-containing protein